MTREEAVKLSIMANKGQIKFSDAIHLIKEYCIEKGKKKEHIHQLVEALRHYPLYIIDFSYIALEYFSKKYHLTKVYNKNNQVLLIY